MALELIGLRSRNILATNNFTFEVKAIVGLESTHQESRVAKIGLNGSHDKKG